MDPAAELQEISGMLQKKFDEAGMSKVALFTDQMGELLQAVQNGPDKTLDNVQGMFKGMTGSIEEAIKDPTKLAPSGGGLAACGAWYGGAVAGKLMMFKDEIDEMVTKMTTLAGDVKDPVAQLAVSVKGAIEDLEKAIKGLATLPKMVKAELDKVKPEDVGNLDTAPWTKALEVGDISGPIDKIVASKEILKAAVATMSSGVSDLQDFLTGAPDKVRSAFDVPQPLCFLSSMVLDSAPTAMKDLLAFVEKLEKFSLEPIMQAFSGAVETVGKVDAAAIKAPVEAFVKEAKELVGKLDNTVKAAKLASSGGGMLTGLKKMF